jgi:hypothetical protein
MRCCRAGHQSRAAPSLPGATLADRSGIFLIWEPTLLEGENRAEWLDRFSACRVAFAAVTDDEFAAMESHMRLADFPEPAESWRAMGHQAGFANAEQLFMMPNRLGRTSMSRRQWLR